MPTPPFRRAAIALPTEKATAERILSIRRWTERLFSLCVTRSAAFRFVPGQYARLGIASGSGGTVWRPYSMVSADYDEYLEFFSIIVPGGAFSTRLAEAAVGDTLHVDKQPFGFLTTQRFVGGSDLWLIASGTGVAPFLSILRDPAVWSAYENLILVYSVREARELAYREEINALPAQPILAAAGADGAADGARARFHFVPVVTRQRVSGLLERRVTALLRDGALERQVGLAITAQRARILLCGNPQMLDDVRELLQARGLRTDRSKEPGHFASENYW